MDLRKVRFVLAGIFALVSMGCAHTHTRGAIVAVDEGKEGHVCIESEEVKPGDKLVVYETVCKRVPSSSPRGPTHKTTCEKVPRGTAEVTETSDQHYSKVRALDDLKFKEGQVVEKIRK